MIWGLGAEGVVYCLEFFFLILDKVTRWNVCLRVYLNILLELLLGLQFHQSEKQEGTLFLRWIGTKKDASVFILVFLLDAHISIFIRDAWRMEEVIIILLCSLSKTGSSAYVVIRILLELGMSEKYIL